jgi:hypothetical protein
MHEPHRKQTHATRSPDDVVNQLPLSLQRLLIFERFHLYNTDHYQQRARDPHFDTTYLPQNCGAFRLPCFWVHRRHFYLYSRDPHQANCPSAILGDAPPDHLLFPIHPTALNHYSAFLTRVRAERTSDTGLQVWAVPTASTRTVLAWPDQAPDKAVFFKTSLHSEIFGDRRLGRKQVARSIGLSALVQDSLATLPAGLEFFPEPFGMVPRQMADSGAIVRTIPAQILGGQVHLAPLFSLIGGSATRRPLLLVLLEKSELSPQQLIDELLCAAFARIWLQMSIGHGLHLEAHGQDLLIALSPELTPTGTFLYRDFEGMSVDWDLRRAYGFAQRNPMPLECFWSGTYGSIGYRYQQLNWGKLAQSILYYVSLVLKPLESSLIEWQKSGALRGARFGKGDVIRMFSRCISREIDAIVGRHVDSDCVIYSDAADRATFYRFAIVLMKVRNEVVRRLAGN